MWSPTQPLINIATGEIVSEDMTGNVSTTKERGEQAINELLPRITSKVTSNSQQPLVDSDSPYWALNTCLSCSYCTVTRLLHFYYASWACFHSFYIKTALPLRLWCQGFVLTFAIGSQCVLITDICVLYTYVCVCWIHMYTDVYMLYTYVCVLYTYICVLWSVTCHLAWCTLKDRCPHVAGGSTYTCHARTVSMLQTYWEHSESTATVTWMHWECTEHSGSALRASESVISESRAYCTLHHVTDFTIFSDVTVLLWNISKSREHKVVASWS